MADGHDILEQVMAGMMHLANAVRNVAALHPTGAPQAMREIDSALDRIGNIRAAITPPPEPEPEPENPEPSSEPEPDPETPALVSAEPAQAPSPG